MSKNRKFLRGIAIGLLYLCTAFVIYSIIVNPIDSGNIMPALAVAAGFIILGSSKNVDKNE